MYSVYPDNVTGREFEIAGPDFEYEEEQFCADCQQETVWTVQGYDGQMWASCACGRRIDADDFQVTWDKPPADNHEAA